MPLMMDFFDSDDLEEKYQILVQMETMEEINDHLVDNLAASLDVVIDDGPIDKRFAELKNVLRTKMKYESTRLRR
ncbi:MAG: hypothetical protein K5853_03480 [Lachnospiraceae bacterium]|nr:hypothetical protein [Lachnospiraceae bacterium]